MHHCACASSANLCLLACGLPPQLLLLLLLLLHRMLLHFGLFVAAAAAAADLLMLGQELLLSKIAGLSCRLNSRTLPYRAPAIKSG